MNPRPILIATCVAIGIVALALFFGKHSTVVYDTTDTATQTPTYESISELPTESESLSASTPTQDSTVTYEKAEVVHSDSLPDESDAPSDPEAQTESASDENFNERVRLFNAFNAMMEKIDSYGEMPDEKDFENQSDYHKALIEYLEATEPLHEQAYKLHVQYLRTSYTPKEFEQMANLFRAQARDYDPDITDDDIENLIKEARPQ